MSFCCCKSGAPPEAPVVHPVSPIGTANDCNYKVKYSIRDSNLVLYPIVNGYEYAVTTQACYTSVASGTALAGNIYQCYGLTAKTTHYFIRTEAIVGGGFSSSDNSAVSFTTPCNAISPFPLHEDFDANRQPSVHCWSNIQGWAGAANWTYATGSSGRYSYYSTQVLGNAMVCGKMGSGTG